MNNDNCKPEGNKHYYAYIYGNPLLSTSYYRTNFEAEFGAGRKLIAVYTKGGDQYPNDFSPKLKQLIADALASGVSQPEDRESAVVFMNY